MRLQVIAVGRLKAGPERDLCQRYAERFRGLMRSCGFRDLRLCELAESPARRGEDRQVEEAKSIAAQAPLPGERIVLDERGTTPDSTQLADFLARARDQGCPSMSFIIGGPDGLAEDLRTGAALAVSFGRLTLPHQIVRVLVLEQLYRVGTILTGHPYHRV